MNDDLLVPEDTKAEAPIKPKTKEYNCSYLDLKTGSWVDAKTFIVKTDKEEIFYLTNYNSKSQETKEIFITYNFGASYSRVLPSDLTENAHENDGISKIGGISKHLPKIRVVGQNVCYVIFKTLEKMVVRPDKKGDRIWQPPSKQDQYHIFSFKFKEDDMQVLSSIKQKISRANFRLRYFRHGLRFQIEQRIHYLTYKSIKQVLRLIANLMGIALNLNGRETIQKLFDLVLEDSNQLRQFKKIISSPVFLTEIRSLVYKTVCGLGLFPSFVEINTMEESSVMLWIKKMLSNAVSAPWGSSHHASFSVGNHRYSFIHVPGNPSMQNKVSVSLDIRRDFRSSQSKFNYFRLQFFDFFPMNSWIDEITNFIREALELVQILQDDDNIFFPNVLKVMSYRISLLLSENSFPGKIASEFEDRYSGLFVREKGFNHSTTHESKKILRSFGNSVNKMQKGELVFLKLTNLIADAEIRGYSQFSNNCQTVVSEIVNLFCSNFHQLLEPLITQSLQMNDFGKSTIYEAMHENFDVFASYFNKNLPMKILPFNLKHQLSYFGNYSDEDTCKLLDSKKFDKIRNHFDDYYKKPEIVNFLKAVDYSYKNGLSLLRDDIARSFEDGTGSKWSNSILENGINPKTVELENDSKKKSFVELRKVDNTSRSLSVMNASQRKQNVPKLVYNPEQFAFISHLVCILYNELFTIRKKIKINTDTLDDLNYKLDEIHQSDSKKKVKNSQKLVEMKDKLFKENSELYARKYVLSQHYQEACYYYYNSVRLGVIEKFNDNASCFGYLIIRNPEYKSEENEQEGDLVESLLEKDDKKSMIE